MSKLTSLFIISQAFAQIKLDLDNSLVLFKTALKSKPDMTLSTIVLVEESSTPTVFQQTVLIKSLTKNHRFPNSHVIIKNHHEVLNAIDVVKFIQIITVDRIIDIKSYVEQLRIKQDQNRLRRMIFLVNRIEGNDLSLLQSAFQFVWDKFVWNCNIVYMLDEKLRDYIYNPFSKAVYLVGESKDFVNQFDKFRNLYGYEIPVSMAADQRLSYKKQAFSGNYFRILLEIGKIMNASFVVKLEESLDAAYESVSNRQTEFCFIGQFHGIRDRVKFTEPFKRNDIVLLVPMAGELPHFMNLLSVFPTEIWALIFLSLTSYVFLLFLSEKKDLVLILLNVFGTNLGVAIGIKAKTSSLVKTLYVSLMFFGIVLNAYYNSGMLAAIISRKFYKDIDTLQEFVESGLGICSLRELAGLIPEEFKGKVVFVERKGISGMILGRKGRCGYALMRSHAESYVKEMTHRFGNGFYHIVGESFIPGFESFFFQPTSPYIYKVNQVLKRIEESGLFFYKERLRVAKRSEFTDFVPLSVSHLSSVFLIFGIGVALSALVFFLEILHFRVANKSRGKKILL